MASARAFAIHKAPYFASVIYGFVFVALEGIRTMLCTPKMVLGYDPEWAVRATVEELAADIVHEVNHFVRKHFERAVGIDDPELFNMAGDFAINPDMKTAGWQLAADAIFPEHLKLPPNLSTEEYYQLLKQMKQNGGGKMPEPKPGDKPGERQQPQPQQGQGQQGQGQKPGQGQGQQGQKPSQGQGGQGQGQGEGEGSEGSGGGEGGEQPKPVKGICQGHCGGLGGDALDKVLEQQLDGTPDLGRSPGEMAGIEKRVANDIKQHIEQHGRGSVPGSLHDWANNFDDEPHVRWEDELAHVIRDTTGRMQAGGDDFSLRRPSKRSFLRGFLRPGMVENLPEVAIIRDSSGSMGPKQLTDAARESYGIMQSLGIEEVWFADADTEIAVPWKRVGPQFFRELKDAHGRGGTDFRQGIESAMQLNPRPDLIVYVTDGDGTTTKMPPPNVAVVWAIVPSHFNKAPAKWGHCVLITDDKAVRKAGPVMPDDDDEDEDAA